MSDEGFIFLLHLRQQPLQRHKMQFCTFASWLALVASGFSCYRYVCVFCLGACVCLAERFVYHLRTKWANALVYTCVYTDRHWLPSGASCRFPLAPLAPCLHSCLVFTPCASAWLTSERLALNTRRGQKVERWFA